MKTKVVQVLLRRSETSETNDVVYAHEIPVLQIARGPANVTVTDKDCSGFALKPFELNARDEMIRLLRKYKGFSQEGVNPVNAAFPDGSRDIELFYKDPDKFSSVTDQDDEDFFNDDETFESPIPPKQDVKTEDKAPETTPNPVTMELDEDGVPVDRADLLSVLAEMKVEHPATLNNVQLKTLLLRKREENFKKLDEAFAEEGEE